MSAASSGRQATGELRLKPVVDLPFKSQTRYWWSVMVWDGAGNPSRWSTPTSFITGVFGAWQAKWIAAEPDRPPMPLPLPAM